MLLSLKVLRGVGLAIKGANDIYCCVLVDEEEIGTTSVHSKTSNPIWGDPKSSYKFFGDYLTKVKIEICFKNSVLPNNSVGNVSLTVDDVLESDPEAYINHWCVVEPLEGYKYSGKLQIRLMEIPEVTLMKAIRLNFRNECKEKLLAGPKLKGYSRETINQLAKTALSPVILHVYDVGHNEIIRKMNFIGAAMKTGGIFHGAIEIYGKELSFGGAKLDRTGIFSCYPKENHCHEYRQSFYLGDCELNSLQVMAIIQKMEPEWMAPTYDLLLKNCCHFCQEFAIELGVGFIPPWTYSLANVGGKINQIIRIKKTTRVKKTEKQNGRCVEHCLEERELDNIMLAGVQTVSRQTWPKRKEPKKPPRSQKKEDRFVIYKSKQISFNNVMVTYVQSSIQKRRLKTHVQPHSKRVKIGQTL